MGFFESFIDSSIICIHYHNRLLTTFIPFLLGTKRGGHYNDITECIRLRPAFKFPLGKSMAHARKLSFQGVTCKDTKGHGIYDHVPARSMTSSEQTIHAIDRSKLLSPAFWIPGLTLNTVAAFLTEKRLGAQSELTGNAVKMESLT
jgi:hypothetical protein